MRGRVAVNLTWVAPGRVGGSEQYLVRQLLGLTTVAGEPGIDRFDLDVFASGAFHRAHRELTGVGRRIAPIPIDNRAVRLVVEHSWLAVRTRGYDVVHHGGGTVPLVGPGPTVLTIHDLQYLAFPEHFGRVRRTYLAAMTPRSASSAAVITVPTEFVRSTVVDVLGADPDRVLVVPHGVPDPPPVDDEALADVRRRHGLHDAPYLVYPAITHPHKHHEVLVAMLDHLADDTRLVLIGGRGRADEELERAIIASPSRDRIVRAGRVDDRERDALLAGADALVFPSEYEGFGAPLVEAMANGVPVVAFEHPAIAEVVGDAAVTIDVRSVVPEVGAAWADGVVRARRDRPALVARGRRRRERFTLATSGRALGAAYRLAIELGAGR
jgi:alpha-1,3-rhamnosyl/mannosyltransferase